MAETTSGNIMRITEIEDLHCNAGWRDFSFLKISTDEGVVGWSEFMESYGSEGLSGVIRKLGARLIGWDALQTGFIGSPAGSVGA